MYLGIWLWTHNKASYKSMFQPLHKKLNWLGPNYIKALQIKRKCFETQQPWGTMKHCSILRRIKISWWYLPLSSRWLFSKLYEIRPYFEKAEANHVYFRFRSEWLKIQGFHAVKHSLDKASHLKVVLLTQQIPSSTITQSENKVIVPLESDR